MARGIPPGPFVRFTERTRPVMTSQNRSRRRLGLIVVIGCLAGALPVKIGSQAKAQSAGSPRTVIPEGPLNSCEQAGIEAEQANGLPGGILLAIGRVESGRWDPAHGRVTSWPWTINAAGKGSWFETREAAAQTVRALLDGGTRSIDVGCFQINLQYHPLAFASPEQGFDPESNARYAARFLLSLFSRTGSWEAAVEAYHSADPVLGFAYRQQVFSVWGPVSASAEAARRSRSSVSLSTRQSPVAMPMVIAGVQIWTPMPFGKAASVVAMPGVVQVTDPSSTPVATAMPALPIVTYRVRPPR
jgi:hypothetical protein